MFKARQLDKLVAAGIITATQKLEILDFDDKKGGMSLITRVLSVLAVFTIGIGIISLVAACWDAIGDTAKLAAMFGLLWGAALVSWKWLEAGKAAKADKMLLGLFMLCGAAIGLIIQIFQLSGGEFYMPFCFWCLVTAPLLFVAGQKLVSCFWVPLFLVCFFMATGDKIFDFMHSSVQTFELLMTAFLFFSGAGHALSRLKSDFSLGKVMRGEALFMFYLVLAVYIGWGGYEGPVMLLKAAVLLVVLSLLFYRRGAYALVRRNVKFGGFWVVMFYINLGAKLGLFNTGLGMVAGGIGLLALGEFLPKMVRMICREKKNAEKI